MQLKQQSMVQADRRIPPNLCFAGLHLLPDYFLHAGGSALCICRHMHMGRMVLHE